MFTEHLLRAGVALSAEMQWGWASPGARSLGVRSRHHLLTEGAVGTWEGEEKRQPSKNNSVFRKEEGTPVGSHCALSPPSFSSINNKIK